jgi:glycosyltransferase involved in cell wall biosynthesis
MSNLKIVANSVVCNEECWVWYSLKSILPFVNQIIVWDTGSKDHTVSIIKSIKSSKISFRETAPTPDESALSQTRQQMLNQTKGNWLMIVDGDEVWPEKSLKEIVDFINTHGKHFDSIVVPTLNCVGDIYHTSSPDFGKYKIAGRIGHFNLRFINLDRVKGLHVDNRPGKLQSYYDSKNIKVQDRDSQRIAFLNTPYLHMTHLTRSNKRRNELNVFWRAVKKRYELGIPVPEEFNYPRVFNLRAPIYSASPWKIRSLSYYIRAKIFEPLRQMKHLVM